MGVAQQFRPSPLSFHSLDEDFQEVIANTEQMDEWLVEHIRELPQYPLPSDRESRQRLLRIASQYDTITTIARRAVDRPVSLATKIFRGKDMRRLKEAWTRVYVHTGELATALRALATAPVERLRWLDLVRQMPPDEVALLHVRADADESLTKLDAD
jgi:hypothetical protein